LVGDGLWRWLHGEKGTRERKERKERKKEKRKKKKPKEKGEKRKKVNEKLEENCGENREIRKRIFGGISRFSGANAIFGMAVMARRGGRRDHGKPGIPGEVVDNGVGAARSERRWPE
jgi:hypothetical protein